MLLKEGRLLLSLPAAALLELVFTVTPVELSAAVEPVEFVLAVEVVALVPVVGTLAAAAASDCFTPALFLICILNIKKSKSCGTFSTASTVEVALADLFIVLK